MTPNMNNIAILRIDYDECRQSSYKGLILKIDGKEIKFNTGDPIIDWINYVLYGIEHSDLVFLHSSSVNDWFMDGDKYFELTLDYSLNPISEKIFNNLSPNMIMNLPTFIAKDNIKTIKDLEDHYLKSEKTEINLKKLFIKNEKYE